MNFEEVYKDFKIYASNRHKKQGLFTITNNFDNHVLPYFKNRNVEDITKLDIINWQNDILSKNYSNKYNSLIYYSFNSFMTYCVACDYIPINVVSLVGTFRKRVERKSCKTYNLLEFVKFRLYVSNFAVRSYFTFMFFYGTRPGETMALRFCDLNFNKVSINHNLRRKGDRGLDTPKNQSSIRTIKINLLMVFRIWLLKRYYLKNGGYSKDYYIFGGLKPLSPTTIDRYKLKACNKSKLQPITQHQFRHSYATRMVKLKPINVVSKSMGHSRVSTTLDIYVH